MQKTYRKTFNKSICSIFDIKESKSQRIRVGPIKYLKRFDMVPLLSTTFIKMTLSTDMNNWTTSITQINFNNHRKFLLNNFCNVFYITFKYYHNFIISHAYITSAVLDYFAENGFQVWECVIAVIGMLNIVTKCRVLYVLDICYPRCFLFDAKNLLQSAIGQITWNLSYYDISIIWLKDTIYCVISRRSFPIAISLPLYNSISSSGFFWYVYYVQF